ncbi:uncharacterized protein DUF3298 [Dyadobacter jejuensis]|uniref:Uncharacterized protein DUF3298 n=1 Tax=Dyadobacter jejuensis TaxID=1082580 RepID=A0A316AJJ3_9BACT|nr:DUF3298 and DUF4163 domain-containing protein [Dyadobacter jejuensis]PWJ57409.1 uncharacterized protein DUF3298 [Dyadobacter jejuensis]
MKHWLGLGCVLLGGLLLGCGGSSNDPKLTGQKTIMAFGSCDSTGGVSVKTEVWLPEEKNPEWKAIGATLSAKSIENILGIAGVEADDSLHHESVRSAFLLFEKNYTDFKADFPEAPGCWEIEIKGDTIMTTPKWMFYALQQYFFTGGAHPNTLQSDYAFDLESGKSVDMNYFISDTVALLNLAEKEFRKVEKLGPEVDLEEQGYFLANHKFFLPANYNFTREGLRLYYNPYEIAAYVRGSIVLTIPYDRLEGIVKMDLLF